MGDMNTVGAAGSELVGGGAAAAKGVSNYTAYAGQGSYQRGISNVNASLLRMQSADAERRGALAGSQQLQTGKRVVGAQRVAFGNSGTDVNSGSAALVQAGAKAMSEIDALTIENNAHLEALGYKMDAINMSASGRMAAIAGRHNANQSLVQGGMGLMSAGLRAGAIADRYTLRVPVTTPRAISDPGNDELKGGYDPGQDETR